LRSSSDSPILQTWPRFGFICILLFEETPAQISSELWIFSHLVYKTAFGRPFGPYHLHRDSRGLNSIIRKIHFPPFIFPMLLWLEILKIGTIRRKIEFVNGIVSQSTYWVTSNSPWPIPTLFKCRNSGKTLNFSNSEVSGLFFPQLTRNLFFYGISVSTWSTPFQNPKNSSEKNTKILVIQNYD